MSGCAYCEDNGEGAQLIEYARTVKQLIANHIERCKPNIGPHNEAYSALSVVNAILALDPKLNP